MAPQELAKPDKYELVTELARRRGFFWQSYEIYGGLGGFIDLGPLGANMRRKIEDKWIRLFVRRHGFYEISTPVITPQRVFEASGHLDSFKDPMTTCTNCNRKFRADQVIRESFPGSTTMPLETMTLDELDALIREREIRCPECGGVLTKPEYFMTMFRTTIGPYSDAQGYARPEAAQGMFVDFKRVYETTRGRLPLGIAQVGKVLRNEISPRQGPIRLREFTIMELELFFDPLHSGCPYIRNHLDDALRLLPLELRDRKLELPEQVTIREALGKKWILSEWSAYFMALSKTFVTELGVPESKQRFVEKYPTERAHYSRQTFDHEIWLDRWEWVEVAGHSNRTDYDLKGHIKVSGVDMSVFEPHEHAVEKRTRVAEPILAALGPAFKEKSGEVAKALAELDPEEVAGAFAKSGYIEVAGARLTPQHVRIVEKTIRETGRKFIPHVVEPSFGAERLVYAALEYGYGEREDRVVLGIPRDIAPVEVMVLPLVTRDNLAKIAQGIFRDLVDLGFIAEYDESGTIGRRYARADEVGVPVAVTVDYDTEEDKSVTLRDRDSWSQVRVPVKTVTQRLRSFLDGEMPFDQLGPAYAKKIEDHE